MLLADYTYHVSGDRCFEFDPETGAYSHFKVSVSERNRAGYSGVGQLLRSPGRGRVLVAKYLLEGDAWFSIGAEKWKLLDGSVTLTHGERFLGLLCELSLHHDGRPIRTFRYLRKDWHLLIIDPTYDHLDFDLANLPVGLVPHDLSSLQKQREDFIALWSGHSPPDKES